MSPTGSNGLILGADLAVWSIAPRLVISAAMYGFLAGTLGMVSITVPSGLIPTFMVG